MPTFSHSGATGKMRLNPETTTTGGEAKVAQQHHFYRRYGKRMLDAVIAAFVLVLTVPAHLAVAAAVAVSMGRPVVFRQVRPGLNCRPFIIYKFRTMRDAFGPDGRELPDDERLTRLGHLLRATSLDELPQLVNVLRGDMSLVGPRPFLVRYLPLYTPEQNRRHEVRPGITGWTAVNGRNDQSWQQKLESDVWYVDNLSFALDIRILWRTMVVALGREGVSREGHVTGEEFTGA